MATSSSVTNQTLDRGLRALTYISTATSAPNVNDVAADLGIHRSMAYRIIRTLESHGLVRRDPAGRCHPGHRLADLSRGVERSIREVARPELERLAERLMMTTFLAVASGPDALTIDSAEPRHADSIVSYRPGTRHPLDQGAPGIALLAGHPPLAGERSEVEDARQAGWARSAGEVIAGLGSLATWVRGPEGDPVAAIACLFPGDGPADPSAIVAELLLSAELVARELVPASVDR